VSHAGILDQIAVIDSVFPLDSMRAHAIRRRAAAEPVRLRKTVRE
jgi:hypothetical protein